MQTCVRVIFEIHPIHGESDQKIVLKLNTGFGSLKYALGTGWVPVQGMQCSGNGKCKDASQAKIWLKKTDEKLANVSGKYELEVDAHRIHGSFVLAEKFPEENPYICE